MPDTIKVSCPCGKREVAPFTIRGNTCGVCRAEARRNPVSPIDGKPMKKGTDIHHKPLRRKKKRKDNTEIDQIEVGPESNLDWNDIRGLRQLLLIRTDWTQTTDSPKAVRDKWRPLRTELRDITDHLSPDEAKARIDEIMRVLETM